MQRKLVYNRKCCHSIILLHFLNFSEEAQRNFVLRNVFKLLTRKPVSSNRYLCEWVVSIMEKIQSSLTTDETFIKIPKSRFLLDIFMVSISIASGLLIFSNKAPILKSHTIDLFPEALAFLSTKNWWKNFIIRVSACNNCGLSIKKIFSNYLCKSIGILDFRIFELFADYRGNLYQRSVRIIKKRIDLFQE